MRASRVCVDGQHVTINDIPIARVYGFPVQDDPEVIAELFAEALEVCMDTGLRPRQMANELVLLRGKCRLPPAEE